MLSWVALHLAVAISALDGDESSRRELDINYSNQCKNLATKYGKKQRLTSTSQPSSADHWPKLATAVAAPRPAYLPGRLCTHTRD